MMKKYNLDYLKWVTGFFLIVGIIFYAFSLLFPIGSYIFSSDLSNEAFTPWMDISLNTININSHWDKMLLFFSILNYSILLYALYQFRALLILFQNNIIFEKKAQKQLALIGKFIIRSGCIFFVIEVILMFMHWKRHTKMFTIYLAILLVGLFFEVLAEVFKRGRKLKEETELTI